MMEQVDRSIFWDLCRTLTHNALFNFIVGIRGGGKSYGAKKRCIDNFIKNKEQFGYIRRFKDDLKKPMEQFFKDIEWEYPDYEMKIDGDKFLIRLKPADEKEKWSENDIAGYGFTLSTADNKKSISYPKITTLFFDEFLLEEGSQRYLRNEPRKLLNLYETVARPGTGHPRVILFMVANTITVTNPYFLYFDLKLPKNTDKNGKMIWRHPKKSMIVEIVDGDKLAEAKKQSEFGGIIEGTDYAPYSLENKFLLDDETFIEKKTPKARYYLTFVYKDNKFGLWVDASISKMFVSKDIDPSNPFIYSLTLKDHTPNTMLLKSKGRNTRFGYFIENYKIGNVRFEDMNTKNLCYEVIKMVMN